MLFCTSINCEHWLHALNALRRCLLPILDFRLTSGIGNVCADILFMFVQIYG